LLVSAAFTGGERYVPTTPNDLYALIRKDHRKMIALLAQIISLSDRAQAVAALEDFKMLLRDHERVEADALYPTFAFDTLPSDIAVAHASIRCAVDDLEGTEPDASGWWEAVVCLRQSVERHIVEEETALRAAASVAPPRDANPIRSGL
jgi:hypothetical protein